MWDSMAKWMAAATFWDWFWHIVAVGLVLVFSIPGVWWPAAVRLYKRWFPQEEQTPHNESNDQQAGPSK